MAIAVSEQSASFAEITSDNQQNPAKHLVAPLLPVALGLMLGIAFDNIFPKSATIPFVFVICSLLIVLKHRESARAMWFVVFMVSVATGMIRHAVADRLTEPNHIARFIQDEPVLVNLSGTLLDEPRILNRGSRNSDHGVDTSADSNVAATHPEATRSTIKFILEACELRGKDKPLPVQGKVAVSVQSPFSRPGKAIQFELPAIHTGDRICLTGWLHRVMPPRNPGEYDWKLHHHRAGIDAAISCEHEESIVIVETAPERTRWVERLRNHLHRYLVDPCDDADESSGILSAMVLGRRTEVSDAVNQAFIKTGNSHFLAASGTNIGLLMMFGWWVLMRLGGLHYRKVLIIIAGLIVLFLFVAEPQPSILRAAIIGLLGCWGLYIGGRRNLDNALACSIIIILMIDPMDFFRPAFQFSYLAVVAITKLEPRMASAVAQFCMRRGWLTFADLFDAELYPITLFDPGFGPNRSKQLSVITTIISPRLITMSISAWAITIPLTCYYFNQFTPWGWFGTLVMWFPVAILTLTGFMAIVCALIFPPSSAFFSPILLWLTHATLWLVNLLAQIPGTLISGRNPSFGWVAACYAFLAWIIYSPVESASHQRSKIIKVGALILLICWLIPPRWINGSRDALNVWMLAVGGGSGTVIELPNGKVVIYDLGTRSSFDVGRTALAFLSHRGITQIDSVIISHTDYDHLSGVPTLVEALPVGRVIVSDHFKAMSEHNPSAKALLSVLSSKSIPVEVLGGPKVFQLDPAVEIDTLWPPSRDHLRILEPNASSIVLRLAYQDKTILLPGDIESEAESLLLKDNSRTLKADVLALPHHGSVTPATRKFLSAVSSEYAVRSTGQSARMTTNGIDKLCAGYRYYSTADDGCIHIEIREGKLNVSAFNPRPQ